ncbi:MAG: hypothetical protein A2010_12890 [Nitrospirae bacterium GWD2_57_9]|nr:MAG: hypothetical protein A2010_12890 [Nitrospirae bacterium GWD2_57_9]OGW50303.1 MAG: hypothetical protein A2078_10805 [Nitrospirae bacterium GWC2_57_9]
MQHHLKDRVKPFLKLMKLDVPYYFFRGAFFINKVAVAVEKDLSALPPLDSGHAEGLKLVAITPAALFRQALIYPQQKESENRYLKALYYLKKGYRGFALAREKEVCGDMWYVDAHYGQKEPLHPDLKWLGIQCGPKETYAFDMHVYRQQRGKNLAPFLQNGGLHELQKEGFVKVYGYYWADYLPALWVHRTLRFKELKRIKVTKLLFIHHYE